MFKNGFTYQQVSDELNERYRRERTFSVPSIKPIKCLWLLLSVIISYHH